MEACHSTTSHTALVQLTDALVLLPQALVLLRDARRPLHDARRPLRDAPLSLQDLLLLKHAALALLRGNVHSLDCSLFCASCLCSHSLPW